MSLIGFDDIPYAMYSNPALTTISRPVEEIGSLGTSMLFKRMIDPDTSAEQLLVKTQLVVRDSVADV